MDWVMAGRKPTVSDQDILDIFRAHEDVMLATTEVAEELGMTRQGTIKRLRKLEEAGDLKKKHFGNQIIWALADDVTE